MRCLCVANALNRNADGRYELEPARAPGLIVVFAGDIFTRLTAGAVLPIFHRVVHDPKERISFPFFQRPPYEP